SSSTVASTTINTPSTATSGGALAAATYFYKITAINAAGFESYVSNEVSQVTTGATSTVSLAWSAVPGAVSYKIYRSTASNAEVFLTSVVTTSFTDAGAILPTIGIVPTQGINNTIGSPFSVNEGALLLNKTAGQNALAAGAITLNSGNNIGGQNFAALQTLANYQFPINQSQLINLTSTAKFDVPAGVIESLQPAGAANVVTLTDGPIASSQVTVEGQLYLNSYFQSARISDVNFQ